MQWLGPGAVLLILSCSIPAQTANRDYPDWFLSHPGAGYAVGLSTLYSKLDISYKEAWLDAVSMYHYLQDGIIEANIIRMDDRIADSLGMKWKNENIKEYNKAGFDLTKISEAKIGNLYLGLFEVSNGDLVGNDRSNTKTRKITAIGKFTIKNKRVYEAWVNAEIEALAELSRIKESKIKSIVKLQKMTNNKKISTSRYKELVELKSRSEFYSARIEKRWVKRNVANVMISDYVPLQD